MSYSSIRVRLREFINTENKKVEEYTVKVLQEKRKHKEVAMNDIKDQISKNNEIKITATHKERQLER